MYNRTHILRHLRLLVEDTTDADFRTLADKYILKLSNYYVEQDIINAANAFFRRTIASIAKTA